MEIFLILTHRQKEREKDRLRRRLARQKNTDQKVKNKLKIKDERNILKQTVGMCCFQRQCIVCEVRQSYNSMYLEHRKGLCMLGFIHAERFRLRL